MYSRFLREAAEVLKATTLIEAANTFDEEIKAIRELELAMLPDELPNMAQIRRIFLETNRVQENMEGDYRRRMRELDEQLKTAVSAARRDDYEMYLPQIPKVQAAIQKVHDLEAKAWTQIKPMSF
jgi:hypothetical protein